MNPIRCIVIDDEPLALQKMDAYISKVPFLYVVALCESAFEAMEVMSREKIDAIFVDINMPDMNGMDFISTLATHPFIVFTTAYAEYAVESYRYSAVDYLLKPFDFIAFQRAADKLRHAMLLREHDNEAGSAVAAQSPTDDRFYVKVDYRLVAVSASEIMYVKGMNEYVQIYRTQGKPLIARVSMKQMMERLPENFLQVHRSYIVNMDRCAEIERMRVVFPDGTRIPIGENFKQPFTTYMARHSLTR